MLLYFYGPDTFRSRQHLKQSIAQFKKQRDQAGYNVVVLDGKKVEPTKLVAELRAAPFLAEKRLVVIENILSSSDKSLLQQLAEVISDHKIPESTNAIFWQGETLSKVKEAKELQEHLSHEKYAQEFAPLTGPKLTAWIHKEVTSRGGAAQDTAAAFLATNAGHDMWLLNSLIDQLVAYSSSAITVDHVKLFVEEKIDDSAFAMIDAIISGNKKLAFTLLTAQRRLGEEDGKLFGLLIWQLRVMLEIADLLASEPGITSDVVARELGVHPFVVKKNFAAAKKYSLSRLRQAYADLLTIDVKTKTGQADQGLLMDMFVASLA